MPREGGEIMKINERSAMSIWKEYYGDNVYAKDFDGGLMYKYAYGDPNYFEYRNGSKIYCGWNIHHILPKACGGDDSRGNLICTNIITNEIAGDKISYWIDDNLYQVKKIKGTHKYAIYLIN